MCQTRTAFEAEMCEQSYLDVLDDIRATCARFVRVNGGDLEDAISIANETFMKVYNRNDFDPEKSSFKSWINSKVWFALLDEMRTRVGKLNRLPRVYLDFESRANPEDVVFDRSRLLKKLSKDARTVVKMILGDSIPLALEVYSGDGVYTPGNVRRGIRKVLKDRGWSTARVVNSFQEITQALEK